MKVSVLKLTLAMRDAARAVEILNHRARRRHDAAKFKCRSRAFEKIRATPHVAAAVKPAKRGPRMSDRRHTLDELDVYRSDVAYEWALL